MRLVTLNVRNPSFDDGPDAWPHRREAFFETLRRLDPDVLCLQETHTGHLSEILESLPDRLAFGVPREEVEHAEMCAVVVREGMIADCSGTEWLCETPDVPGTLGWDARCPRVLTWVDLGSFAVLNTHLDHMGLTARTNGMAQVLRRADALGKPCLIAGDFNAPPDEPALDIVRAAGFTDLAAATGPTFHGFGRGPEARIDYVLARGPWRCERAWVERGDYSDHWAVTVDVSLAT